MLGGDGTYHEVINVLIKKKQEEEGVDINDPNAALCTLNIPFGLIPTGKYMYGIITCI
jgi:diacylglycerol kinase family enzyme